MAYIGASGFEKLLYSLLLTLPLPILFRLFRKDKIILNGIKKTEHFQSGCVNPAVVLDAESGIIATFADLKAYGNEPVPVVKILREKLRLVRHEKLYNGKR